MKKEKLNYFDEFIKGTEYSIKCSNMLLEIVKNFKNQDMKQNIEKIHKIEHEADEEKHHMMKFLLKDFLPPIEREDIIKISHRIDNVTDLTEEILINLNIFNVKSLAPEVIECAELLVKCCDNLKVLLTEFANFKKSNIIQSKIVEINKLEEEGDSIYHKCMKKIYANPKNVIDIIIWTTIYNCFEECFDACESVADYIETVIMKNS
ncbi:MAG: DUF47 family protein [Clostridia bacterium]|nr:DUF47 family protein [Clostridia bacterium]